MSYKNNTLYNTSTNLIGIHYKLYNLAKWKNGFAFKTNHFSNKGIPIIKIAELNNGLNSNTKYTQKTFPEDIKLVENDLVFSWSGNPNTSIDIHKYKLKEGWLNQHIYKISPNNEIILTNYFYYLMKYLKPNFIKIASNKQTTGLGHVTISDLKNITVTIPDINTQKKIASILSALDDKIELNNKINKNLEEMAQAIFKSWFVDFKNGKSVISDFITPKRGRTLLSKNAIKGIVPVVAGGLNPSTYHNASNTIPPVISISASGANAGYVNLWEEPIWSSDSSFIDKTISSNIYFWYLLLKNRQKEIFDNQTGSAQPHIYPKHIMDMRIPNFKIEEIEIFTEQVSPIFKKIGKNKKENNKLNSLRDTLLPKLMSGELDVSTLDI